MARKWTDEEIQFLKFAYNNKEFTLEEIAKELKRSKCTITSKARKNGIQRYKEELPEGFQRCRRCKCVLPLANFNKSSRHKSGIDTLCKSCDKERKIITSTTQVQVTQVQVKKCTRCNTKKSINNFYKNRATKDGFQHICKECTKEVKEKSKLKLMKLRGW